MAANHSTQRAVACEGSTGGTIGGNSLPCRWSHEVVARGYNVSRLSQRISGRDDYGSSVLPVFGVLGPGGVEVAVRPLKSSAAARSAHVLAGHKHL